MKCPLILVVLFVCMVTGCKKRDLTKIDYINPFQSLSDDALLVVFSSSIEGSVKSCGCTSAPLGDIARYAQVFTDIKASRKKAPLFIDAGNLLFDTPARNDADLCQDNERIGLLLATFKELGLKETIAGPLDDARGSNFRDDWYKKAQLNAFIRGLEHRVIEHHGHLIGLIGLRELVDTKVLQQSIDALTKQKVHLIIALSQRPKSESIKLFENMAGIDVVIQGQVDSFEPPPPMRLGAKGPIFIEGGRQQHYFSVLIAQKLKERGKKPLKLDESAFLFNAEEDLVRARLRSLKAQAQDALIDKRAFLLQRIGIAQKELHALEEKNRHIKALAEPSIAMRAIPLGKKVDPLARVNQKLGAYEKSISRMVSECEKSIECPKIASRQATFVGAESCKACHAQAFDVWKKAVYWSEGQNDSGDIKKRFMGHSKAWQTLIEAGKENDRSCIGCHSIGFMQPGGYCKASEVSFRVDVQCESCHGPGSLHAQSGDKRLIQKAHEGTCRGCHHVPHIEHFASFNFDEKVQLILGPGHGEQLLKQLQHKAKERSNQHRSGNEI